MSETTIGDKIAKEIDRVFKSNNADGFRTHLGASVIGKGCPRALWYDFRWVMRHGYSGQMFRLFSRGKDEEPRMIEWLRSIGAVIEEIDPETKRQYRLSEFGGHFGGSCDGKISNLDRFGLPGVGLLEGKTHAEKYFKELHKHINGRPQGVRDANPEHFVQMQVYMHFFGLEWGLYVAVNKNNDALYIEAVPYLEEVALKHVDMARDIITARTPPPRINESPAWYKCRMCAFKNLCHYQANENVERNCRSCSFAVADLETGGWKCTKFGGEIPKAFLYKGCEAWDKIET